MSYYSFIAHLSSRCQRTGKKKQTKMRVICKKGYLVQVQGVNSYQCCFVSCCYCSPQIIIDEKSTCTSFCCLGLEKYIHVYHESLLENMVFIGQVSSHILFQLCMLKFMRVVNFTDRLICACANSVICQFAIIVLCNTGYVL